MGSKFSIFKKTLNVSEQQSSPESRKREESDINQINHKVADEEFKEVLAEPHKCQCDPCVCNPCKCAEKDQNEKSDPPKEDSTVNEMDNKVEVQQTVKVLVETGNCTGNACAVPSNCAQETHEDINKELAKEESTVNENVNKDTDEEPKESAEPQVKDEPNVKENDNKDADEEPKESIELQKCRCDPCECDPCKCAKDVKDEAKDEFSDALKDETVVNESNAQSNVGEHKEPVQESGLPLENSEAPQELNQELANPSN